MNQHHLIVTDGGAGDLICALVAVNYNITHFPDTQFQVWVPDYLLTFAKHVLPKGSVVRPFSKAPSKFKKEIPGSTTQWASDHSPIRTHPMDYAFHMLSGRHCYRLEEKNYPRVRADEVKLKYFNLPEKYVVIMAAAAEPCKTMPLETANAVIDLVISRGYDPVFLGRENAVAGYKDFSVKAKVTPMNFDKGVNLINKTDFLQSAAIIDGAAAYIGMDGGLTHLAGFTDTHIVAGYTLADPIHLAPVRNDSQTYKFHPIEPDINVENRYYQTYHSGFTKTDARQFPGWENVVASMTSEKFIKVLETLL